MSKLYVATHPVGWSGSPYDHLYIVYDPDNNPYNNNELIIRGSPQSGFLPTNTSDILTNNTLTFGAILVEVGVAISSSLDALGGDDPFAERYYTALNIAGLNTENLWAVMQARAAAIHSAALTYELEHQTHWYEVNAGQNSNSVVASLLLAVGVGSPSNYVPPDYTSDWPGLENSLSSITSPTDGFLWGGLYYKLGTSGTNTITGASAARNYVLDGGAGNDVLTGNEGDDALHGGDGTDTAVFSGLFEDYRILSGQSSTSVQDQNAGDGDDGTDTLYKIERLQFFDGTYENGVFKLSGLRAPVAETDTAIAAVNGSVNINVFANDYDPDNQTITIALGTQAAHGTATLNMNGTFTYVPDTAFSGIDTFTYTITDTDSLTATGVVTIAVGSSVISGTSGNDGSLSGTSGADIIQGLAGDDDIDGLGNNDIIYGDAGDDFIYGGGGSDQLFGGSGKDLLEGEAGNDMLYGGAGEDSFYGSDGTEQFIGGSGSDAFFLDLSVDTGWVGINENDSHGTDRIYLTNVSSGDHIDFTYNSGTNQLDAFYYPASTGGYSLSFSIDAAKALAGTGVEYIVMDDEKVYSTKNIINAAQASGGSTFVFDIADYETNGYPVLLPESLDPFEPIVERDGGVSVFADWGGSGSGYSLIYAEELFHALKVTAGSNPSGVSTMPALGYIKNFYLHAGIHSENVRITVDNSDNATITIHLDEVNTSYNYYYFEDGYTTTGYSFSSTGSVGVGNVIGHGGGSYTINGSSLAFSAETTETYFFEKIIFDDGDAINLLGVLDFKGTSSGETLYGIDRADIIHGFAGVDYLYSKDGDDLLVGGLGADGLYGGLGDDTYDISVGDSSGSGDIVGEQASEGIDTMLFHDIAPEDLRFWTDQYGYFYLSQSSGDLITGYGAYTSGVGLDVHVERIVFDDSTVWDLTAGWLLTDTDDAHTIYGSAYDDTIDGRDGADAIYGWAGADILIGGIAADWLYGGTGDDTYVFSVGESPSAGDVISEQASEGIDTVLFHGIDPEDLRLWVDSSGYIYLSQASGDLITGYGSYTSGVGVELNIDKIEFDDTTIWDLTAGWSMTDTDDAHTIYGSGYADTIDGRDGADSLYGWAGADVLIGGIAADWLYGGTGDDTYVFSVGDSPSAGDIISEQASEGIDTILFHGIDPEDLRLWIDSSGYMYLSQASGDLVTGYGVYTSGVGVKLNVDKIEFDDTTVWDLTTGLLLTDTDDAHTIYGSGEADTIDGRDGADSIYGWAGADTLIGGIAADWLYGGTGNDTYVFSLGDSPSAGDIISEQASEGIDTVLFHGIDPEDLRFWVDSSGYFYLSQASGDLITGYGVFTAGVGVELNVDKIEFDDTTVWDLTTGLLLTDTDDAHTVYGSSKADTIDGRGGADSIYGWNGADVLLGGAGADYIYGGDGNDILEGGADDDTMDGEGGSDTASYLNAGSAVTVTLATVGTGQNTSGAGTDTLNGIENLIGSAYNDTLTGDGSANVIEGGAGNDAINGAGGTDTVSYAGAGSAVTVNLATGTAQNTVGAGTDTLTSMENLLASAYNDTITGSSGNNVIDGGAGNDTLDGSGGTDTASYASASAAVTVSLALGSAQNTIGAGTDALSNFENLTGSAFGDVLTGSTGNNTIAGGDGDDTVEGGAGTDTMTGGNGTDTVSFANAGSATTFNLATTSSQNTISSGSDTVSGFENILGSAFNDTLTGNGSANVIEGGAGDDTIDGAGGTDTLTYRNAASAVTMSLATGTAQNTGGAGTDTISNFENLTGSAYNDTLTGNGSANVIEGGAGNDTIDGAGGTDTVTYVNAGSAVTVDLSSGSAQNTGGAGTDTLSNFENLTGSAYNDTLTGTTGNNTVLGGDGNDTIYGNSGTDTLRGGNGNDTLSGQAGTDTLYGEGGSDIFAFEVASAFSNQDTIADFSISDGDILNISALLVGWNPTQSAIDDFVTFGTSGANMTLSVDRDGTGGTYSAQAIATLSNISGLDADDLLAHGQLLAA